MSRRKIETIPAGAERHEHLAVLDTIATVERLRSTYAAAVIAAGIVDASSRYLVGVVEALAEDEAEVELQAMNRLFRGMEAKSPGSARIVCDKREDNAEDVLTVISSAYGEAGFMLGLAVGMQLGPDAFKIGGQR